MTTFVVTAWHEPEGGWSARADIPEGAAFTSAESLAELDRNIRESIAGGLDLPRRAEAELTLDIQYRLGSPDLTEAVEAAAKARAAAAEAPRLTAIAVRALRHEGMSVRDTARIVGISPGRVAQIDTGSAA